MRIAYIASGKLCIGTISDAESYAAPMPDGVENITWSPDSKQIAFTKFVAEPGPEIGVRFFLHPLQLYLSASGQGIHLFQ